MPLSSNALDIGDGVSSIDAYNAVMGRMETGELTQPIDIG